MKGIIVDKVIKVLTEREYGKFLDLVSTCSNGADLVGICKHLRNSDYSEEVVVRNWGHSKRRKNHLLFLLGELLEEYFRAEGAAATNGAKLLIARRLFEGGAIPEANSLMAEVVTEAWANERFDQVIKALELKRMAGERDSQSSELLEKAYQIQSYIHLFESRYLELGRVQRLLTQEEFEKVARQFRIEAELAIESTNESHRLRLAFLKLVSRVDIILKDRAVWLDSSEKHLALLTDQPWLSEDFDVEYLDALRRVSHLCWQSGEYQRFWVLEQKLRSYETTNPRAEIERLKHDFPFMFFAAIEAGSVKLGKRFSDDFDLAQEQGKFNGRPQMLTRTLYFQAYFWIFANDLELAGKVLAKLSKFSKQDFSPPILPASEILSAVLAIELEEWEECIRICANLLKSNRLKGVNGSKVAATFLSNYSKCMAKGTGDQEIIAEHSDAITAILQSAINSYFDFGLWLESRQANNPMLVTKRYGEVGLEHSIYK